MGQTLKMRGGVERMMGIASILFMTFYYATLFSCSYDKSSFKTGLIT